MSKTRLHTPNPHIHPPLRVSDLTLSESASQTTTQGVPLDHSGHPAFTMRSHGSRTSHPHQREFRTPKLSGLDSARTVFTDHNRPYYPWITLRVPHSPCERMDPEPRIPSTESFGHRNSPVLTVPEGRRQEPTIPQLHSARKVLCFHCNGSPNRCNCSRSMRYPEALRCSHNGSSHPSNELPGLHRVCKTL